jgi:hypothetical protein
VGIIFVETDEAIVDFTGLPIYEKAASSVIHARNEEHTFALKLKLSTQVGVP